MASTDVSTFPVKGQAYRLTGKIVNATTGNPITGGLTVLTSTVSKDGAAFASTTSAAAEIGTTGYFTVDLTSTEMDAYTVVVHVSASNTNAVYASICMLPIVVSEEDDAWDDQTVKRLEQALLQGAAYSLNKVTITNADENGAGTITLYKRDGTTAWLTGTVSDDGTVTMKGTLA